MYKKACKEALNYIRPIIIGKKYYNNVNDAIIMTKYDSTAKGGVAISIGKDLGIPVFYVCTGETYSDISLFNCDDYLNTFLGL